MSGKRTTAARKLSLIALTLLVVSCTPTYSRENAFSLRALPIESKTPWQALVPSSQSGTIAALCYSGGVRVENITVTRFAVGENHLTPDLSIPRAGVQPFPKLLLKDNRLLTSGRDPTKEGADFWSGANVSVELIDARTGAVVDITPSNLQETPRVVQRAASPRLWTEAFGLVFLVPDKNTRGVSLWQGKERLEEVQKIHAVLAIGKSFVDGQLTPVVVTEDGNALIYDYDSGEMKESPEHQALAAHIAEVATGSERWPFGFVMAEEVAAFKWGQGKVFVLLAADGSRQTLRRRHAFEERADGSRRRKAEGDALSLDPARAIQTFTEEARATTPEIVSNGSVLVPVDETHVGIFDRFYQRLIVIGPPERSGE